MANRHQLKRGESFYLNLRIPDLNNPGKFLPITEAFNDNVPLVRGYLDGDIQASYFQPLANPFPFPPGLSLSHYHMVLTPTETNFAKVQVSFSDTEDLGFPDFEVTLYPTYLSADDRDEVTTNLQPSAGTITTGSLTSSMATLIGTGATTLTAAADNHYLGRAIIFTSGTLQGQARLITGYSGVTGQVTYDEPTTSIPAEDDAFVIV